MSSLIPSGSASGTGSMTLIAPVTNSNQVVTLPDATGTAMVSGAMPAFSAWSNSSTSVSANTWTKISFQIEEFDTAACYDTSTSRFTPNVAGYYLIGGNTSITNFTTIAIYKNSTEYKRGPQSANNGMYGGNVNGIVYMNGSTDYVELFVYQSSGTQTTSATQPETYFNGCLVRAA